MLSIYCIPEFVLNCRSICNLLLLGTLDDRSTQYPQQFKPPKGDSCLFQNLGWNGITVYAAQQWKLSSNIKVLAESVRLVLNHPVHFIIGKTSSFTKDYIIIDRTIVTSNTIDKRFPSKLFSLLKCQMNSFNLSYHRN